MRLPWIAISYKAGEGLKEGWSEQYARESFGMARMAAANDLDVVAGQ